MRRFPRLMALGLWAAFLASAGVAQGAARTLEVGAGKPFPDLTHAAAAAQDGDRVLIAPGEYFDCAVWPQNNLTIEGASEEGTVIGDKACQGKALLVIDGTNVTVRNLTLTRVRVPDGNGAGIRAEGRNLLVEHVRFINNQNGILSSDEPQSTIIVRDSQFTRNGACEGACAHGLYAGHIALLRVERSVFRDTRVAHNIKSRALRTEVVGCDIADGPNGTGSYAVDIPNGGSVLVTGSQFEKGPNSGNHTAFIMIGEEGVSQPTREITVTDNVATLDASYPTRFVDNGTATEATLSGNRLVGRITPLHGDGSAS